VYWFVALQVAGGVGLFLYGIKLMSDSLQSMAGERMRHLLGTLTSTPMRGVFLGIVVTVLFQSSTASTVMVVSFVNAGLMTLIQAIGIIMGANIGSTVTVQIIAFKVKDFALPFVALGAAFVLFGKSKKQRYFGNGIIGFALLFLGLQTMESSAAFFNKSPDLFITFGDSPILGFLAGLIATMIIQSSAATIGLTIAMASQGLLTVDASIPIIMGANLGSTLTAVIAAIGANRSAKQAAAAHVLFNIVGVTLIMMFLSPYKEFILLTSTQIERQLANSHTLFNIINTLLFLPFTSLFARLIQAIIPSRYDDKPKGPIFLDKNLIKASPIAAVEAVKDELLHMGDIALGMAGLVRRCYKEKNIERLSEEFAEAEVNMNTINRSISSYASEIWQKAMSSEVTTVLGYYVNAAGDLERVGDHFENLVELAEAIDGKQFSDQAEAELWTMYDTAEKALAYALDSIRHENVQKADIVIKELEKQIDAQEKQYRKNHIERLNRGECDPEKGVIFIDILSNLERIGDHSNNIANFTRDIVALSNKAAVR